MVTETTQKQQLPRMENRELAQGRKRRKGMRLNLRLEGGHRCRRIFDRRY